MKTLTADEIVQAKGYPEETIDIPEWGGSVTVRSLSMGARSDIAEKAFTGEGDKRKVDNFKFAILSVKHGLIVPKLTDEQADKLADKGPEVIERLLAAIWKLSNLSPESAKNELPQE